MSRRRSVCHVSWAGCVLLSGFALSGCMPWLVRALCMPFHSSQPPYVLKAYVECTIMAVCFIITTASLRLQSQFCG